MNPMAQFQALVCVSAISMLGGAVDVVPSGTGGPLVSVVVPTVKLNNGVKMPMMLWGSGGETQENATSTAPAVRDALITGFPGIDAANHYHNQVGVARGIAMAKASGSLKHTPWLQTKVEPCGHSIITPVRSGHCYNDTLAAFEQNLEQLDVSIVDLTLIHSPPCVPNSSWADPQCMWPDQPDAVYPQHCNCAAAEPCAMMREQWKALEHMYHAGKTRAIGVSNFCQDCLACIAQPESIVPAVNQLQFHAGMPGPDPGGLLSYCAERGIIVQAYSPLGGDAHAALLGSPIIGRIAATHGNKTTAQVCLRWVLQLGLPLATSTVNIQYMQEDLGVWGWELSSADMSAIDALAIAPDDPVKSMCLL
jgi:2,5-diketo-D-gluconate reductase A|eukprot:m.240724 g.240724  ORF g.240724 m.240724 type:complete len:364 (+) comp26290_c0_seq4:3935-5026(+)